MGYFIELSRTCPQQPDLQVSWDNEQRGPFQDPTNSRSPEPYPLVGQAMVHGPLPPPE